MSAFIAPFVLAGCADQMSAEQRPMVGGDEMTQVSRRLTDHAATSVSMYTFHSEDTSGCLDPDATGLCNHFTSKDAVYFSGGPTVDGLKDGDYYFAVLAPGYQTTAVRDGVDGNLSDSVAGKTEGDDGSGDTRSNRTFTIVNHEIDRYVGKHHVGESAQGRKLINVGPFDDTPNPAGLYVLAICPVMLKIGSECELDAFLVNPQVNASMALVGGSTYYDANTDGHLTPGEPPISGFKVLYQDGVDSEARVALDGHFFVSLDPDDYTFMQEAPDGNWMQTGNLALQAVIFDRGVVALDRDMSYDLSLEGGSVTDALLFGDVCLGKGGGHDHRFWGGTEARALIGPDDLKMLGELNLRRSTGKDFDPATVSELQEWFDEASPANMANQLSIQVAAMALSVQHGFVTDDDLAYTPDIRQANDNGFASINELMDEADVALGEKGITVGRSPARNHQEHLKMALGEANRDESFVQKNPLACTPHVELP